MRPASRAIPMSHTTMLTFRVCFKTASIRSMYSSFPAWRHFEAKKVRVIVGMYILPPSFLVFSQILRASLFSSIRLKRKDESATRVKNFTILDACRIEVWLSDS